MLRSTARNPGFRRHKALLLKSTSSLVGSLSYYYEYTSSLVGSLNVKLMLRM